MKVKPKYKLGQKVILVDRHYFDGKSDVGYIVGIEIRRSYDSAGIFQLGGLNIAECEKNGYLETYMKHVDVVLYHVIRAVHTSHTNSNNIEMAREVSEDKLVPYNKENAKNYVE